MKLILCILAVVFLVGAAIYLFKNGRLSKIGEAKYTGKDPLDLAGSLPPSDDFKGFTPFFASLFSTYPQLLGELYPEYKEGG